MILVAVVLLSSGCKKLKKLQAKGKECERQLTSIEKESDKLQEKIKVLRSWEKETPPPQNAIAKQSAEIDREQGLLNHKTEKVKKVLDEILEEIKDLSDTEWEDVLEWATENIPKVVKEVTPLLKKTVSSTNAVNQGVRDKCDAYSNILDEQIAMIHNWASYPPLPHELEMMAELIADASAISLHEELELIAEMANDFEYIGPLPVVAGTTIDRCSFIIEEGLPPGIEYLDDGVLTTGTEIIIQLPPGWKLTAPVTFDSNNLVFDSMGNEPGSNIVKTYIVDELEPNKPDDMIVVIFNGIEVGRRTGIMSGAMTVMPGRSSKQDFVVLPCDAGLQLLADLDLDGAVNFKDLAILGDEWLLDTGPCP